MSSSSSYSLYNELSMEEVKIVAAAKNHLAKADDSWNDIIEGFQLLDALCKDLVGKPVIFCHIVKESVMPIKRHLKSQRGSVIRTVLSSISLWVSVCKDSFLQNIISLWPALIDCFSLSKKIILSEIEETILTIIHAYHSPVFFSAIVSPFTSSSSTSTRYFVMRCIGECIRCWSHSVLSSKKDTILQLTVTGMQDRSSEVRDVSHMVFCLLYCRVAMNNPVYDNGDLTVLLSEELQESLSYRTLKTLQTELNTYIQNARTNQDFWIQPFQWPTVPAQVSPVKQQQHTSPIKGTAKRVYVETTPIKGPQRVKSIQSPLNQSRLPSSRIITPKKSMPELTENSQLPVTAQLDRLPTMQWVNQQEVLKQIKQELEKKKKKDSHCSIPATECSTLLESLACCIHSSVVRVISLCLEILKLYVEIELNQQEVEKNKGVLLNTIKRIVAEPFMNSENTNSQLMQSILTILIQYQNFSFNSLFVQFFAKHLYSYSPFLISFLLPFLQLCLSLHKESFIQPDFYQLIMECCYQCILLQSHQIDRAIKGLLLCLQTLSSELYSSTIRHLPTSKRMGILEYLKTERISTDLKVERRNSISSRLTPKNIRNETDTSRVSEIFSETSDVFPLELNLSNIDSLLEALQNGQYCSLPFFWDSFNYQHNAIQFPHLYPFWSSQLNETDQQTLANELSEQIAKQSEVESISPRLFIQWTVFYKLLACVKMNLKKSGSQLKCGILAMIRCPFASYRMIGFSIIKQILPFLEHQHAEEFLNTLSEEEKHIIASL